MRHGLMMAIEKGGVSKFRPSLVEAALKQCVTGYVVTHRGCAKLRFGMNPASALDCMFVLAMVHVHKSSVCAV